MKPFAPRVESYDMAEGLNQLNQSLGASKWRGPRIVKEYPVCIGFLYEINEGIFPLNNESIIDSKSQFPGGRNMGCDSLTSGAVSFHNS